jgi:ABC-type Fe3+-hydroxamate transport system substrate-binding protein
MTFTDQLDRTIHLKSTPGKIVSIVPSQTELLYDLGLDTEVAGITKFCIHPETWFRSKARVGGTKTVDIEKVRSLQPDLIIANKEENVQEQVETLQEIAPVWVSDINNLNDALKMIIDIGKLVGKPSESSILATKIKLAFDQMSEIKNKPASVAYLIWKDPYMTVGGDTFINDMLQRCGFTNIFHNKSRYPETNLQQLAATNCEIVLLSSEPYPFKQNHIAEMQAALPNTKFMLVDGEMFSWYGSRLLKAPAYFATLRQQVDAL